MLSNLRIDQLAWRNSYPPGSKQSPSSCSHHMTLPVRVVALSWEERLRPFTGAASRSRSASSKVNWCHCGVQCRASVFPMGNWSPFCLLLFSRYRFCQVQKVQVSGRIFFLTVINADASHTEFGYRMVTRAAANALYRCVTEMHAFYRCHTVHEEVTSQTNRDFRTTLVSLFSVDHESSDRELFWWNEGRSLEGSVWRHDRHVTLSLAGCWVRPLKASMWFPATGFLSRLCGLARISQEQKNSFYFSEWFLSPKWLKARFLLREESRIGRDNCVVIALKILCFRAIKLWRIVLKTLGLG